MDDETKALITDVVRETLTEERVQQAAEVLRRNRETIAQELKRPFYEAPVKHIVMPSYPDIKIRENSPEQQHLIQLARDADKTAEGIPHGTRKHRDAKRAAKAAWDVVDQFIMAADDTEAPEDGVEPQKKNVTHEEYAQLAETAHAMQEAYEAKGGADLRADSKQAWDELKAAYPVDAEDLKGLLPKGAALEFAVGQADMNGLELRQLDLDIEAAKETKDPSTQEALILRIAGTLSAEIAQWEQVLEQAKSLNSIQARSVAASNLTKIRGRLRALEADYPALAAPITIEDADSALTTLEDRRKHWEANHLIATQAESRSGIDTAERTLREISKLKAELIETYPALGDRVPLIEPATHTRTAEARESVHKAAQKAAQRIMGVSDTVPPPIPVAIAGSGVRAGKDTVGDMLAEHGGYVKFNVSDALNRFLIAQNPIIDTNYPGAMEQAIRLQEGMPQQYVRYAEIIERIGYEEAKEIPDVRHILRTTGTDAARSEFGMGIWNVPVARTLSVLSESGNAGVVAGVRYHEDWQPVKDAGGVLVYVQKDQKHEMGSTTHSSENTITAADADYVIMNNGTKEELRIAVDRVAHSLAARAANRAREIAREAQSGTPYDH